MKMFKEKVDVLIVGASLAASAAAKRLVFGEVGIDAVAGPTEVVIVGDSSARADFIAADLIAQAEHDQEAMPICIGTSRDFLRRVDAEVTRQLARAPRRVVAAASLSRHGLLILVRSLQHASNVVNRIAPEHLEIMTDRPQAFAQSVRAAGAVFLGPWATEALGDYVAGPNHTLPTSGTARFASALSVADFVRFTNILACTRERFLALAPVVETLAKAEGLYGHAASVEIRRTANG